MTTEVSLKKDHCTLNSETEKKKIKLSRFKTKKKTMTMIKFKIILYKESINSKEMYMYEHFSQFRRFIIKSSLTLFESSISYPQLNVICVIVFV